MKTLLLIALVSGASLAQAETTCVSITGSQIIGADLARAIPEFAGIQSDSPLAPAPLPGATRVFYRSELQSIASRFSLAVTAPNEVCFKFATEALNRDRALAEMRKVITVPDSKIEILETSPEQVPAGRIEFTREGLGEPAASDSPLPVSWRGNIIYAGDRRFPVVAKVRIKAPLQRVVAAEPLRSGVPVRADQLRQESFEGFPLGRNTNIPVDQLAGLIPVRPVAAGGEVRLDNLTRPNDVNRGDLVHVEVRFGAAHLALMGRAETAGRIGDLVAIRNPESSKVFQARIEAHDRVIVMPNQGGLD
jgi:flagella basal body P-ring formation protein FlgA